MFKKLNFSTTDIIQDPYSCRGNMTMNYDDVFIEYSIRNERDFLQKVQELVTFDKLPDNINFTEIKLNGPKPHTDASPTALNFYLDVDTNDSTVFFEESNYNNQKRVLKSYPRESLVEVDRFVAQPYDVYLLNTHKIHVVDVSNKNAKRAMIRFLWMHKTFEEVLQGIKIKAPR